MIRTMTSCALALTIFAVGCDKQEQPSGSATADSTTPPPKAGAATGTDAAASGLRLVSDRSLVCMVNNQFMGQPQIPIEVSGKTYYGCCEMCKGRLANDPKSRSAVDPVSKRPVDKSVAVIAKTKTGATLYFENEQNFTAYAQGSVPN